LSEIRVTTVSDTAGTGPVTLTKQYASKAWVNFNGSGTLAIRGNGNVGSVTDNGTGDYTLNFTSAMADANYSVVNGGILNRGVSSSRLEGTNTRTTTQCQVYSDDAGTLTDFPYLEFSVNGDLA
jgi:hypothetical protein